MKLARLSADDSVNWPPAKILPSACTAIALTKPLAFGLKESVKPVVASSRAMRIARRSTDARELAARQNLAVRLHRDRPNNSVRTRVERISQAGGGIEPGDAVARLSADAVRSWTLRKTPPTRTLPSACTAIE